MNFDVIFEDNHLIVINKHAGVLSQGDSSGVPSLLEEIKFYLKEKYNKPGNVFLGLVHRLDKPVSGVMVYAKTSKAASRLHKSFITNNIQKYYVALVESGGNFSDTWTYLEQYMTRVKDKSYIHNEQTKESIKVIIAYKQLYIYNQFSLLIIKLITGKKHQIRAQLSSLHTPIINDKKYGHRGLDKGIGNQNYIYLHATSISFKHPVQDKIMNIHAPPPEYFFNKINLSEKDLMDKVESIIEENI